MQGRVNIVGFDSTQNHYCTWWLMDQGNNYTFKIFLLGHQGLPECFTLSFWQVKTECSPAKSKQDIEKLVLKGRCSCTVPVQQDENVPEGTGLRTLLQHQTRWDQSHFSFVLKQNCSSDLLSPVLPKSLCPARDAWTGKVPSGRARVELCLKVLEMLGFD